MRNFKKALLLAVLTAVFALGFATAASAATPTAVPTVNEVSQSGGHVVITGSHLGQTTSVLFQDVPAASFKVVGDTEVDALAPTLPVGLYELYLAGPGGNTDTGIPYEVYPPAPTVSRVSINAGSTSGGDTIVVTGQHLSLIQSVSLGGPPKTYDAKSDTEIDIVTEAHAPGPVTLSITTLGGTVQEPFAYVPPAHNDLSISSLSPDHGFIGGNTSVTIYGTGFELVNSVRFAGIPAKSYAIISNTEIDAISPFTTTGGTSSLAVSDGTSTAGSDWTYNYVGPWITGISPATGPTHGGSYVTVNGSGFTGVTSATVGGKAATIVSLSDKAMVIQVPAHHAGNAALHVTNPAGSSNNAYYRYH